MVFFTCNHCGESARKLAVAKHYQWKCRGAPVFVSCMDCQKDFRGEEYVAHTSCITEAEKYSGKDYVPKASTNLGQRKQDSWLEIVRSILTTKEYELGPAVRGLFQRLQNHDNVPRKKVKFMNFIKNCMHVRKEKAESVWTVLEMALEKFKATRPARADVANATTTPEANGTEENGQKPGENSLVETVKKSEKKKRKKNAAETNGNDTPSDVIVTSTIKKRKSKQQSVEEGPEGAQPVKTDDDPPRKKKRSKNVEIPDSTIVGDPMPKENEVPPVKKNKASVSPKAQDTTTPNTDGVTSTNSFDWTDHIFTVLAKNNDKISLGKLKRKVLKRYKNAHGIEEIPYKVEKTFNKTLRKSGLLVEDDIVKLN